MSQATESQITESPAVKPQPRRAGRRLSTSSEVESRRDANQTQAQAAYRTQEAASAQLLQRRQEADISEWTCDPLPPDEASVTSVDINSLEGSVGYGSLLRAMFEAGRRRVAFYRSPVGGNLSPEEAWAAVYRDCGDAELARLELAELQAQPLDTISFADLLPIVSVAPRLAEQVWEHIKSEAQAEFESGHLATRAVTSVPHRRDAWEVACFMGLRESFAQQWGINGGIDAALIDMLAQAYYMVQFWTKQADKRMQERPRQETYEYKQWRQQRKIEAGQWDNGWWDIPYVEEQEAIDHATAQVEKWNRIFLRTLRNLRDLRRYAPVTINNPQQVNIATDGGQQVNMKT